MLISMGAEVLSQGTCFHTTVRAVGAFVYMFMLMHAPLVPGEVTFLSEPHAALPTQVWFLACVGAHMDCEVALLGARISAYLTHMWSLL